MANTFKFNGTLLSHQPTTHKWIDRESQGVDGNGRTIYQALRDYEMQWDYLNSTEFAEIYAFYSAIGQTGSVVASLPRYANATYSFFDYSGTILTEPRFNGFYEEHYEDVSILVLRIRV
jgi:hypothetical protein